MKSKDLQLGSPIFKINESSPANILHWAYSETRHYQTRGGYKIRGPVSDHKDKKYSKVKIVNVNLMINK